MASPGPRRRYRIALWLDRWAGPLLCGLLRPLRPLLRRRSAGPDRVGKVLVVKFWGMGSIVLALPVLEELRRLYPGARIDVATLHENAPVLELLPQVDRCWLVELERGIPAFLAGALGTVLKLRRERYDLLLDLEFFTRFSALFSLATGARRSHGFSAKGSARGRLHDVQIPFNAYQHVATNFLTLLRGDPMQQPRPAEEPPALPALAAPAAARERCRTLLESDPAWRPGAPLVVVNPNAGDMALERRWPPEQVAELLRRLAGERELNLVLTGAPADREHVERVRQQSGLGDRVLSTAGRLEVSGLLALLSDAAVFVTNDSGPLHIASAVGTSTVALFGPETPVLYGPLRSRSGQRHEVHYRGLACSPCMFVHDDKEPSCWFARAHCMVGIQPEAVAASVWKLLPTGHRARRSEAATRVPECRGDAPPARVPRARAPSPTPGPHSR